MNSPILGINHIQVFVQGMSAVSRVDCVHPAEMAMLRSFYDACQQEANALTDFDDLVNAEFSIAHAREVLNSEDMRIEFLRSCVFLGYADGNYSATEQGRIAEFASGLAIDPKTLGEIEAQVADTLMGQMAAVKNIDAVREVARKTLPQG